MSKILVVDDRALNRKFLVTLLRTNAHELLEASDGAEALTKIRAERPHLVITDLLMPTMDGFELVNTMRCEPEIAETEVIFYTATYRLEQADDLARACGVRLVIPKPSEPQRILELVEAVLRQTIIAPSPLLETQNVEVETVLRSNALESVHYLKQWTAQVVDRVSERSDPNPPLSGSPLAKVKVDTATSDLQVVSLKLASLMELSIELTSQRSPEALLKTFCAGAVNIIEAKYGALAILHDDGQSVAHYECHGSSIEIPSETMLPHWREGILGSLLSERRPRKLCNETGLPAALGLPSSHPPIHSFLGVPIMSPEQAYGWFYVVDKPVDAEFTEVDEQIATTLAAQLAVTYQSVRLYDDIQRHAAKLELEVYHRKQAEERFYLTIQAAPTGMLMTDSTGRIVLVNSKIAEMFGYDSHELEGQPVEVLLPERVAKPHVAHRNRFMLNPESRKMGVGRDLYARRKDGSEFPAEIGLNLFTTGAQSMVLASVIDITERKQSEEALKEAARLAEFAADVSTALAGEERLQRMLQKCAEAMVKHLDAAFARIWMLRIGEDILELQASAGLYTHIDGAHGRIPVGQFKIGLIAAERMPHLTNTVLGDSRVHDQEWAKREGMVSFAGYPLVLEDRVLGVMALFARKPLSQNTLAAMESVAKGIAIGIERKIAESELHDREERFRELAENINEIFFVSGPTGAPVQYVSPAFEKITGYSCKSFECNPGFWLEQIHPDDRPQVEWAYRNTPDRLAAEYRIIAADGSMRWMYSRSFPVRDNAGTTVRLVGIATDITDRKHAEQAAQRNLERIHALRQIDSAITSTLECPAVLRLLLEKLELFLAYDAAVVRFYNDKTQRLELVASRHIDEQEWRTHMSGPHHAPTYSWRIFESGKPLAVRDLRNDLPGASDEFVRKNGLISLLGVPLIVKEVTLGVLTLYTRTPRDFTQEEVDFLATVGGQASIAIYNARLYEQTKTQQLNLVEQERIQRVLKELSQDITNMDGETLLGKLTMTIREIFRVNIADVRFIANNRWSKVILATPDGVRHLPDGGEFRGGASEWVLNNRRTVAIPDYTNQTQFLPGRVANQYGMRGFLATPLMSRDGSVLGVIRAHSKQPRTFFPQEIGLFEQLAAGAAIAIENEQLYSRLQKSNKVKSEFLAVMSHELRTPLNIIMGYGNILRQDLASETDAPQRHFLDIIERHAGNLLGIINSIMDAVSIESNKAAIQSQRVCVAELFNLLEAETIVPSGKAINLDWKVSQNLPDLVTDHEKLKRILQNVIGNAIKFTETGTITISAKIARSRQVRGEKERYKSDGVEFKISDPGVGIAHENLPLIFEMFRQVDSSPSRAYEGAGLGLYIAKQYADLIGARIALESTPGRGSTFTVSVPLQ